MEVNEDGTIDALTLGRIASFYYLKHESMHVLSRGLRAGMGVPEVGSTLPRAAVLLQPIPNAVSCSSPEPKLSRGV